MDERIEKMTSVESCERYISNAIRLGNAELEKQARLRALQIRADEYGHTNPAERDCLCAVFAYEQVLTAKNGRKTRASRTWPLIKKHGILMAAEKAVDKDGETAGYQALVQMGLQDVAFEAVILRYPEQFSESAVQHAQERMKSHAAVAT